MKSSNQHRPFYRIANQITLMIGGMILVFVVLQGWMVVRLVQDSLQKSVLEERAAIAASIAAPIEAFLLEERDEMSHIFGSIDGEPSYNIATGMKLTLLRNPSLLEIVLLTPDGEVTAADSNTNQILLESPFALQQARWFLAASQGEEYASALYLSDQGEPYLILSQPVTVPDYEGYILASRVDIRFLCDIIHQHITNRYESIYLIAQENPLIAYSCYPESQQWFTMPVPPQLHQAHHPYAGRYYSDLQGDALGASTQVAHTNWVIVNEINAAVALGDVRQIIATIVLLFMVWALLLLSIARLLARLITQPMNALTESVWNFEATGQHQQLNLRSRSEIGVLATAFNHMSQTIAERERDLATANRMLKARSEELADLSRRTIAVEEEERRRVSRDLHDGFGQTLAALKMNVDVAQRLTDLTKIKNLLADATKIANHALDEVHTIAQNLRPTVLDDLGLQAALESYIHQFQSRFGVPITYRSQLTTFPDLSLEATITAYRFLQEALTNVQKHAAATYIEVHVLQQVDYLMIVVKDNGRGFDRQQPNQSPGYVPLGLKGMQERLTMLGGELVIHSKADEGTALIALLPVAKPPILEEKGKSS